MLFSLKKNIMCRVLEKRNQPFDYRQAENYTLPPDADPLINNSYYFSAHDAEMSFFARLGRRVNAEETWFALYAGGKLYSLRQELFPQGQSPVIVCKKQDSWTVEFKGPLNDKDEIEFIATFTGNQAPLNFGSDMPAVRKATGIANEKWNKAFFSELKTIDGQCHYEQEGVLHGQFTLNGEHRDFSLPCVRDHSFGKRDWNFMNNHLWLMAVSEEQQFNYSFVSYPAMSVLEMGNYRDRNGQHFWLESNLDLAQTVKVPGRLSFSVKMDDGRTIPVEAEVLAGVCYHFQDGEYILHENIAEYSIDGKKSRGILETGYNADGSRLFNGRNPLEFRR